jgi:hypothetical protein
VTSRAGRHPRLPAVLVLLVAGAVFWAAVGFGSPSTPYDPASTAPDGAKALAIFLRGLGATVDTSGALPPPGKGVVLVLYDQLDDAARARATAWARRGGTLVVADPSSPLEGASVAYGLPDQPLVATGPLAPGCSAPWVRGISLIAPEGDRLLEVPSGADACFSDGGGAYAVARTEGTGVIVSLGGADPWSNAHLADQDNALLAADLLAPGRGYRVSWLSGPSVGGGTKGIWSLVPDRVKAFLAGVAIALLAAVGWRAKRLGRPVLEEPVVPVPGSELVMATGRLLARNRRYDEAAALIRDDLCGHLRSRLGQAPGRHQGPMRLR